MANPILPDIKTEDDVITLVNNFYKLVENDELLRPIFVDAAQINWDEHLPKMYEFWNGILLGKPGYSGAPWPVHADLRAHITPDHFKRWLSLFTKTVDSHFQGEIAETAKQRANSIAYIFQNRLAMMTA